jgi:hypothetical protein
VCKKFGFEMVNSIDGLREAIMKRLPVGSWLPGPSLWRETPGLSRQRVKL